MPTKKLGRAWSTLQSKGVSETYRTLRRRIRAKRGQGGNDLNILLITNRDSDNVGDQVIEECALALVKAALSEMGIKDFTITSRAAGMISKRYLKTQDPALLAEPEQAIAKTDVVVFGGAPLFNFRYQPFYERTALTLELAHKHQVPVVFSAIGIEGYDEDDERCQRLKTALALPCVTQITTRDNFEALERFVEGTDTPIAKVADPAVLTDLVFRKFLAPRRAGTVGVFVIREHAFRDNGIDFTKEQAAELWVGIIRELEARSLDYELITSGHFSDEAFMELLITDYGIPASKCAFNMNAPEDLVAKISSYDAIISCRLHPSIIAFATNTPAVGLTWNEKVPHFYGAIGYPQRALTVEQATAATLVDLVETAMQEGVRHRSDYRTSAYTALRDGLAHALGLPTPSSKVTEATLSQLITPFAGTSDKERTAKLERKFRRSYDKFNVVTDQNAKLKAKNARLRKKSARPSGQ